MQLCKLCGLAEPRFPHLWNGGANLPLCSFLAGRRPTLPTQAHRFRMFPQVDAQARAARPATPRCPGVSSRVMLAVSFSTAIQWDPFSSQTDRCRAGLCAMGQTLAASGLKSKPDTSVNPGGPNGGRSPEPGHEWMSKYLPCLRPNMNCLPGVLFFSLSSLSACCPSSF